jgi:hypothetical protein
MTAAIGVIIVVIFPAACINFTPNRVTYEKTVNSTGIDIAGMRVCTANVATGTEAENGL